jgi:hypothetical protein
MTTFHLSAFLASVAAGIALPLRFETITGLLFTAGFAVIVVHDYTRPLRMFPAPARRRVLRPRAQFRPLPLTLPTTPAGLEIRPITERLRETNRLAA